jgi:CRISPR-associated protein Csd1
MLLNELIRYEERYRKENAARQEQRILPASGYQLQPIKGIIELDADGKLLGIQPLDGGTGTRDRGKLHAAPEVVRSSGVRAKLLADNAEYVLGLARREGDQNVTKRHAAFIAELESCLDATGVPQLEVVLKFLAALDHSQVREELWPGFEPTATLTFKVADKLLIDDQLVQEYWAGVVKADSEGDKPVHAESLVSGIHDLVINKEPVKIKGIPGGQTSGMNFISANADSFGSYGLQNVGSAPVRFEEAEKYANSLNRLLADRNTSLRLGGLAYIFWTREGDTPPLGLTLSDPMASGLGSIFDEPVEAIASSSEQVRALLHGIWTGQDNLDLQPTDFFAAGLSASGARVAVRSYITITLAELVSQIADFFLAQKLALRRAEDQPLFGVYALAASLYRDFRKESAVHDLTALVNFSLTGNQLPHRFLQRLNARNRAERRVTRPRAVLAKMTLISRGAISMGTLEDLDISYPSTAYQLGRLLAVLDDIQGSVMRAKSTVVDRFYGSMSTTPKAVWGRLMQGTQHHLARLRKEKPGAYTVKQRMLEEVNSRIEPDSIPSVFSLEDQALFSLGYYHQRARISRDIQAAIKARDEAKAASSKGEPS